MSHITLEISILFYEYRKLNINLVTVLSQIATVLIMLFKILNSCDY